MKKLEVIIRPEKLDLMKSILSDNKVPGMMISNIMGYGNQLGYTQQYRGTVYAVNLVAKLKIEIVVKDEIVDALVNEITSKLSTGHIGDGKIFISPVEEAIRIRTGEKGEEAL